MLIQPFANSAEQLFFFLGRGDLWTLRFGSRKAECVAIPTKDGANIEGSCYPRALAYSARDRMFAMTFAAPNLDTTKGKIWCVSDSGRTFFTDEWRGGAPCGILRRDNDFLVAACRSAHLLWSYVAGAGLLPIPETFASCDGDRIIDVRTGFDFQSPQLLSHRGTPCIVDAFTDVFVTLADGGWTAEKQSFENCVIGQYQSRIVQLLQQGSEVTLRELGKTAADTEILHWSQVPWSSALGFWGTADLHYVLDSRFVLYARSRNTGGWRSIDTGSAAEHVDKRFQQKWK